MALEAHGHGHSSRGSLGAVLLPEEREGIDQSVVSAALCFEEDGAVSAGVGHALSW